MAESRRAIAEKLVDLHIKHAGVFGEIDDLKEQLRTFAMASDDDAVDLKSHLRKLLKDDALTVDDLKAELRTLGETGRNGFTEKFDGKGEIQVSGGGKEKFKGIVPTLDPGKFLGLPPARQEWLIAAEVIAMVKEFTKASRPSVTVKL